MPAFSVRREAVKKALRADRSDTASVDVFAAELGEAFGEMHRVLKPRGLLAFTFRHSTADAWLAMAKALAKASLRPVQVLPLPGEAGTGLHTHDGTSLWDAVLVFRKMAAHEFCDQLTARQVGAARASARAWRDRFRRQERVPFNEADFINLFRASLVAASLGLFGRGGAKRVSLKTALETVSVK